MSFTPDATPVASESISTSTSSSSPPPLVALEQSPSISGALEPPQLPPLDAPAQQQRRNHIASYFRKFSAVVRRKNPDLDKNPLIERPAGSSTTENQLKHVISPPSSPDAPRKNVVSPAISRQTSPTSTTASGSFRKRFSTFSGNSSIISTSRQAARDERAAFLFARYGLGKKPASLPIAVPGSSIVESSADPAAGPSESPPLLRVQRKARLRMHTTCHECSTLFAHGSKYCSNCNHKRCRECPRSAPKGVTNLVTQTKQDLSATSKSGPTTAISRTGPYQSAQPFKTTVNLQLLLLPDSPPPSDRDDTPPPTLDDLLKLCAFIPTRKRALKADTPSPENVKGSTNCLERDCLERQKSRDPDNDEDEARAARPVHGPRERVHRKVRQRRRNGCVACGRQHSGIESVCAGCAARASSVQSAVA